MLAWHVLTIHWKKKWRKDRERETACSLLKLDFSIVCIVRHGSSTTVSLPCYLHVHGSSKTFEKVSKGSSEGLNRINCQLSKDLKIILQPSRKVNFYHQLSKVKININLQNVSRCFKSHYFSSSSWDSSSWRISKLEKPVLISQKHFLSTLQYPTTCLYLKIFQNFISERPKTVNINSYRI